MNQIIQYNQSTKLTTLEDAKKHLRVIHNRDDVYINSLIDVASLEIENTIDRDIFSKRIKYSGIKSSCYILGKSDSIIESIVSIIIIKDHSEVGEITVYTLSGNVLSFETEIDFESVEVIYNVLSYYPTIPLSFVQACLILVADFYNQRQDEVVGRTAINLKVVSRLLQPYLKYDLY